MIHSLAFSKFKGVLDKITDEEKKKLLKIGFALGVKHAKEICKISSRPIKRDSHKEYWDDWDGGRY